MNRQSQYSQQQHSPVESMPAEHAQKKRTANKLISNNNRKRPSSSSSSTSSSRSPSNNIFSFASSMSSIKSTPTMKKRNAASALNDSSTDSSSAESGPMPSSSANTSSCSFASPNILIPRLAAQRSVPAFLNKLYNMVDDLSTSDLIRWSEDGTSFVVEKHEEFAKTVLPRFYKHNTFASFVRQLNMYDFHKVPHLQQGVMIAEAEHEIWEFSNPHFQRGRPDLLVLVTRKRNRDRDAIDSETVTLSTLAQDVDALKRHQSTIGIELNGLQRDNEILWQETLNTREKYQGHQEAIEKILQFLTAIFANDNLAIGAENADLVPKVLIEGSASLAVDNAKKSTASLSNSLASSTLSNILTSVLRLHSDDDPSKSKLSGLTMDRTSSRRPSSDAFYPPSPRAKKQDKTPLSLVDFSKTLNTATQSAQITTQDIDMLQVNIESLANDLGMDPNQFDQDGVSEHGCPDNSSSRLMNNQDTALYNAMDSDHQDMDSFSSYNPSSVQYQQQRHQQQPSSTAMSHLQQQSSYPMYYNRDPKLNVNQTPDVSYRQLMSTMNYSDSFGTNYSSKLETPNYTSTTPVDPSPHHLQQNRCYFNCSNDDMMAAAVAVSGDMSATNATFSTMVSNTYTAQGDISSRSSYYDGMPSEENHNDAA